MKTWFDRWMNWFGGMPPTEAAPEPAQETNTRAETTYTAAPIEWLEFPGPPSKPYSALSFGHDDSGKLHVRYVATHITDTVVRYESGWSIANGKALTAKLASWFETPKEAPK